MSKYLSDWSTFTVQRWTPPGPDPEGFSPVMTRNYEARFVHLSSPGGAHILANVETRTAEIIAGSSYFPSYRGETFYLPLTGAARRNALRIADAAVKAGIAITPDHAQAPR